MKNILPFIIILFVGVTYLQAQDENPYAKFGYEGKILKTPQERQQYMLTIPNPDSSSDVALVGIAPNEGKYYLFDKDNELLDEDTLMNDELGRFLSTDPLTASYPWYTPYQFAGNMPIWAIDLDGLEEKYSTTGKFVGHGPDKNSNEILIGEELKAISLHQLLKVQLANKLSNTEKIQSIVRNQKLNKIYSGEFYTENSGFSGFTARIINLEGGKVVGSLGVNNSLLESMINSERQSTLDYLISIIGHEFLHFFQKTSEISDIKGGDKQPAREVLAHHFNLFPNTTKALGDTEFEVGVTNTFNLLDEYSQAYYAHQSIKYINLLTEDEKKKYKPYVDDINNKIDALTKKGYSFPKDAGSVKTNGQNFSKANKKKREEILQKRNNNGG